MPTKTYLACIDQNQQTPHQTSTKQDDFKHPAAQQ